MAGISIVVCSFNGAERLRPTLAHLAALDVPEGTPWELVLVDNNSADGTADVTRDVWQSLTAVPLRILHEPIPGVAAARATGIRAARYDLVGLIDDDNWVDADWVKTALEVMTAHPAAGACGGFNTARYEVTPPAWLPAIASNLAVGGQGTDAGDVTDTRGVLWASGLVLRRQAWLDAHALGVEPALAGRVGASLMSGEDSEMCLRLRLAGWRLYYEPRLRLTHAIGRGRLTWHYIRRLYRGAGACTPFLDGYYVAMRHTGPWTMADALRWSWPWQAFRAAQSALATRLRTTNSEGASGILDVDSFLGRLGTLLQLRRAYSRRVREVVAAVRAGAPAAASSVGPVGSRQDISHAR